MMIQGEIRNKVVCVSSLIEDGICSLQKKYGELRGKCVIKAKNFAGD
jgi:hypothetical protein